MPLKMPKDNKKKQRPEIFEKRGKFYISNELLEDNPKAAMQVMSHMIIIRCEFLYDSMRYGKFEYIALSDLFDKIDLGLMIPEYIIEIDSDYNVSACIRKPG